MVTEFQDLGLKYEEFFFPDLRLGGLSPQNAEKILVLYDIDIEDHDEISSDCATKKQKLTLCDNEKYNTN